MQHASRHSLDVCLLDARLADDASYTRHVGGLRGQHSVRSNLLTDQIGAFTVRRARPGRGFSLLDMRAAIAGSRQGGSRAQDRERMLHDELVNSNALFPRRIKLSVNSAFPVADSPRLFSGLVARGPTSEKNKRRVR